MTSDSGDSSDECPVYDEAAKQYRGKKGKFVSAAAAKAAIAARALKDEAKAAQAKVEDVAIEPPPPVAMGDFVKIKLPEWTPSKPALWFKLCEDTFKLGKVPATDQETRAILVQRALPSSVIESVERYVTDPVDATRYDDLKRAILGQHEESPEEAYNALEALTLGDQKPSALGHTMLAKVPSKCSDAACGHKAFFVRQMFERKLPTLARNGLVGVDLSVRDPTPYLNKADQLMASIRAKQAAGGASEVAGNGEGETAAVGGAGRGGAGRGGGGGRGGRGRPGRGGGTSGTRPNDMCTNHWRFKDKTWVCNGQSFCKMKDQIVQRPGKKKDE